MASPRTSSTLVRALCVALACSGASSALFVPSTASAQSADDLKEARRLFRQGLSLEAAGDFAGALTKFEQVGRVKLTHQVRFHMARCKAELGRLNEALGDYRLAEYEAEGSKELPEISAAREKLEARVPKLVITRGEGAEGARIELDGVELGEAKLGTDVAVDPGPHTLVVRLPSKQRFELKVDVAEGESKAVELIPPDDLPLVDSEEVESTGSEDVVAEKPVVEASSSSLPWIIGGVGVASLAASGIFYMLKSGVESDLESTCRGSVCPKSVEDKQSTGESYALLGNVTFGVGLVGVGVALVMLVSSSSDSATPSEQARAERARAARRLAAERSVWVDVATSSTFSGLKLQGQF